MVLTVYTPFRGNQLDLWGVHPNGTRYPLRCRRLHTTGETNLLNPRLA
jgi:hypothetical protein